MVVDDLKKAQRREYLRQWKLKNKARWDEIKWLSRRKSLGLPADLSQRKKYVASGSNYTLRSLSQEQPIEVDLCSCGRKYLRKLCCLWCNGYID